MELKADNTMELSVRDHRLDPVDAAIIAAIQGGLPLTNQPYAAVAENLGLLEEEVIVRIDTLIGRGIIKRFGVVVRHHELGYRANAMVVWDVPDAEVSLYAERMRTCPQVTLCYRRPRQLPVWPYNLFCMIHGRDRQQVLDQLQALIDRYGWQAVRHEVLFSRRRFKQRGARYRLSRDATVHPDVTDAETFRQAHG